MCPDFESEKCFDRSLIPQPSSRPGRKRDECETRRDGTGRDEPQLKLEPEPELEHKFEFLPRRQDETERNGTEWNELSSERRRRQRRRFLPARSVQSVLVGDVLCIDVERHGEFPFSRWVLVGVLHGRRVLMIEKFLNNAVVAVQRSSMNSKPFFNCGLPCKIRELLQSINFTFIGGSAYSRCMRFRYCLSVFPSVYVYFRLFACLSVYLSAW